LFLKEKEKEMKYEKIDYTGLHDQIVTQAVSGLVLTEEQKQRLFRNKFDRARELAEARKNVPCFRTER
jgi:hypothetical protein